MTECSFEGCGRQCRAKGLCSAHYDMVRLKKELKPIRIRTAKTSEVCSTDGCDKKTKVKNLCLYHYQKTRICKVDNCTKLQRRKFGYCKLHYSQLVLGKTERTYVASKNKAPKIIKQREACSVETCTEWARTKGYCARHYTRVWKYGDPGVNYRRKHHKPRQIYVDSPLKSLSGKFSRVEENAILREIFDDDFYFKDGEACY